MPIHQVTGWERSTARTATWFVEATSVRVAEAHSKRAGLVDPHVTEVAVAPEGATVIRADEEPHRHGGPRIGLFWIIVFAVVVGNLATAAILRFIDSLR